MGRGDKKSKKGKLRRGSNGKSRPTTKNAAKLKKKAAVTAS